MTLTPEQCELFRLCGERILENHRLGHPVSPDVLANGSRWAAHPKLDGTLSSGVPDTDPQVRLHGAALEAS